MKMFGDKGKGITTYVNEKSLIIDVPFGILTVAFQCYPECYQEASVKPKKQKAFAELIAEHLHDETDSETGSNYIHNMFDAIFADIHEGNIDADGTVKFPEEEDNR